ncbi:hypothetical protein ACFQWF_14575 [Methylorubrum suomiense]
MGVSLQGAVFTGFAKAVARRYAETVGAGGWQPRLVGAEMLGTDRKSDVTINVPTALCWLQFRPEVTTGTDEDTRPGLGFTLVAYPESRGEWPCGVIPRTEAARLYNMLAEFLARNPAPVA